MMIGNSSRLHAVF